MKSIAFICLLFFGLTLHAQYQYTPFINAGQNPGGLNTDYEYPYGNGLDTTWTSIFHGVWGFPSWVQSQTLPFPFMFNGTIYTQYHTSSAGILTFGGTAGGNLTYTNQNLPSSNIPDNSICIWGLIGEGSDDYIVVKTFGIAPYRQYWICFSSFNCAGGTANTWTYWSIVLEETTNNIYIVDQRTAYITPALTIGLQLNDTLAIEVTGSPNIPNHAGDDPAPTNNSYYKFVPDTFYQYNLAAASITTNHILGLNNAPFSVGGSVLNKGIDTITNFDINYEINNNGIVVTAPITGVNMAHNDFHFFTHPTPWDPGTIGTYNINVWASNPNGHTDEYPYDDTLTKSVQVFSRIVEKKLLHEAFNSPTCGGCAGGNQKLQSILNANQGKWTRIGYQMHWPSPGDPYFIPACEVRGKYYDYYYIPVLMLNGGWNNHPSYYDQAVFNSYYNVPAFWEIIATHELTGKDIQIKIDITAFKDFPAGLKLHIAVVENTTIGNVGNNGETEFYHVLMKMIPDTNGTDLDEFIADKSLTYYQTASLEDTYIEDYSDLSVVVFIQDDTSQYVHQSAWSTEGIIEFDALDVKCKTYLQSAYDDNSMMDESLNGIVPYQQPYFIPPWGYHGTETLNSIPPGMVDWILVELRDIINPDIIVARRACILLNNGELVDTNLTTPVKFPGIEPGFYFLCINHRNHFPVMSAKPVALPNSVSYDFNDTLNFPPYGGGSQSLIEIDTGIFGMISGDVNNDGLLKYSGPGNDRGPVLQYIVNQSGSSSITSTVTGYRNEDINMDSIIKYSGPENDPSLIIQNLMHLKGSTSITSVYNTFVPEGVVPFKCGDTLFDLRDSIKYSTVTIGDQCWMAENLAYLPEVYPSDSISELLPFYYVYGYDGTSISAARASANYQPYGALYNWPAAMAGEASSTSVPSGIQGVCPAGWHLPSDEEWKILEGEVDSLYGYPDPHWDLMGWRGTDAGGNLKETGTTHWISPNTGATNSSGFTARAGGRFNEGWFVYLGEYPYYWSSTDYGTDIAGFRSLAYYYPGVNRSTISKNQGFSVRCLRGKDICTPQPDQADAGYDSLNISGDSIALMANTAVNGLGLWTICSGQGGYFDDAANPTTIFYGLPWNCYKLVWTISNYCGSTSDTVLISFDTVGFVCGNPFSDFRDWQTYNTAHIGTQCWMADNLNIGAMINATVDQTDNGTIEKYCYVNIANRCNTYGGLYQWNEMMQYTTNTEAMGICPAGWHLPADNDWKILEATVDSQYVFGDPEWDQTGWRGADAGMNLKSTIIWNRGDNGTDLYNFNAIPGGKSSYSNGSFSRVGAEVTYWSSVESLNNKAWYRRLYYDNSQINWSEEYKNSGFSVRCLKDCLPKPIQANAGPDSLNVAGDSIVLMGNTPATGHGFWTIVSGIGGNLADPTNAAATFYGSQGKTYQLIWIISNNCGITSDMVTISFAVKQLDCGTITDIRDGKTYNTIIIGDQCWMKENLNVGKMIIGGGNQNNNDTIEKFCYDNDTNNCLSYGGLYQWDEMMQYSTTIGAAGICPAGWHVPTDNEWKVLEGSVDSQYPAGDPEWDQTGYRGFDAGLNLKSTAGWKYSGNGIDLYGFSSKPAGYYYYSGSFYSIGSYASFWSSSEIYNSTVAWMRNMNYSKNTIERDDDNKNCGYNIRCVKDCSPQPTQSDAGHDSMNVAGDSIVLMGNVAVNGQGLWTVFYGSGGTFADPSNPSTMFYGLPGKTYNLYWTISNNSCSSSDNVIIGFAPESTQPCPGIPTFNYGGQTYNTIQIGTQCWMKENLNIGSRIDGVNDQIDNDTIEKYCYNDIEDSCTIYGGLYQWDEMMQYVTTEGVQGICPPGWHIPTNDEWKNLEGFVDSQYGIGDPEWDKSSQQRGFDAGFNLKSNKGWDSNGNGLDLHNFCALPSGGRYYNDGSFNVVGRYGYFWNSTELNSSYAWYRSLSYSRIEVYLGYRYKTYGYPIRCLKN